MSSYLSELNHRGARPRSKRLRQMGATATGYASTVVINGGSGPLSLGDGHTHANKHYLDQLSTDADDYLYINQLRKQTDAETGETIDVTEPQKVKAGHADIAHDLDPDSPANERYIRKDQDDRTEHSLGVGGDLKVDGAAHIGQAMLVYDEVNHAIRVTAADGSGLTIGLNTSGASGGGGGASALYQLVDVVVNATGDGVSGAAVGKVLMYNGTKWEAATVVIPTKLSQFIDDIGLLNEADRQTILDSLSSHTGNKSNPHAVTKAQVGLGSVDNLAASAYFTALSSTSETNLSATIGGTVRTIAALYATYLGGQPSSYYATAAALTSHTGNKSNPHAVSFSQLTSHPTTVEGYGITNALTNDDGMVLSEAIGDASQQAREAMSVALRAEFLAEHALDDLFELVNLGTDEQPSYAIRAKFGFYSDSFISSMGLNNSGAPSGSGGGASALYQLVDVVVNATGDGVNGAAVGKVLMYNGTKWEAATVVIPTKLSQFIDDIGLLYDSDGQALAVAIHEAMQRAATAQGAADKAQFTAEMAQDAASLAQDAADKAAADASSALSEHTGNKSNPHAVTKAQVGLGSVDNLAASAYFTALSSTSDTNLSATIGGTVRSIAALYATYLGGQPSSYYATAEALTSHTSNKSNPHAVTKAQVGLGSVDNLAASAYFTALSSTSATNLSATIGGTVRSIAALYATYLGGQPSSYYATAAALSSHTGNKSNPHAVSFSQLTSHPTTVEGYGITNALTDDDGIALSEAIGDASQQAREAMSVASNLQQEVDRQLDNDDAQAVISYLMQQIRQLSDQVSRLNAEVNQLRSYWQLDANGDLYTKHNLYSQKAITAMKSV